MRGYGSALEAISFFGARILRPLLNFRFFYSKLRSGSDAEKKIDRFDRESVRISCTLASHFGRTVRISTRCDQRENCCAEFAIPKLMRKFWKKSCKGVLRKYTGCFTDVGKKLMGDTGRCVFACYQVA